MMSQMLGEVPPTEGTTAGERTEDSFIMPEIPPPASTSLPSQPTTTTSSAPSHNTSSSSPSSREAEEERENEKGEVASLPSISSGILDSVSDLSSEDDDDDDGLSDAQREWEASLEQLQLLLTMVVVPFAGKFLGRKFAYWSWARYMEWMHDVEIRWTNKAVFTAVGAVEAAASL